MDPAVKTDNNWLSSSSVMAVEDDEEDDAEDASTVPEEEGDEDDEGVLEAEQLLSLRISFLISVT